MSLRATGVAIIGGGASGTLVAVQLLRQTTQPLRIILYEPASELGRGLAYGTKDIGHLLNVPAGKMSALPENPSHFLDWLNASSNCASLLTGGAFQAEAFAPRALYGCYLCSVLDEAQREGLSKGARLEHRTERIVDFIPGPGRGTVVSATADTEDVFHVVLALGNFPPRNPLARAHEFFRSPRYVPEVWRDGALNSISETDDVLVVGSGLTAFDVVSTMLRQGHQGNITITSRNGRLPQPHAPHAALPDFLAAKPFPATCREWLRLFRRQITQAEAAGTDWRAVLDVLRPHTQEIWKELALDERRRFLRHLRSLWECHRHRVPRSVWDLLQAAMASGVVTFRPGRIRDFAEDEEGVTVLLQPKGMGSEMELRVAHVVNCIGPESNFLHHVNDALLVNLMARGVLLPDPLLLGLKASPDGNIEDDGEVPSPQITTLGPPLRGILWETTAIPEIRQQAHQLAESILKSIPQSTYHI